MDEVCEWTRDVLEAPDAEAWRANGVAGRDLEHLTSDDLRHELGLSNLLVKKFHRELAALAAQAEANERDAGDGRDDIPAVDPDGDPRAFDRSPPSSHAPAPPAQPPPNVERDSTHEGGTNAPRRRGDDSRGRDGRRRRSNTPGDRRGSAAEDATNTSSGTSFGVGEWLVGCVVIFAAHAATFGPSLAGRRDWVPWDDRENFVDQDGWKGTTWRHVRFAFTTQQAAVYEPLAWLAKGAQYRWLFGGRNSVVGYVAVSVAAHTVRRRRRAPSDRCMQTPKRVSVGRSTSAPERARSRRVSAPLTRPSMTSFAPRTNAPSPSAAAMLALGCVLQLARRIPFSDGGASAARTPACLRVACATAATLSFSIHPLRAEVVAWCSCQPYALMTLPLVAALWVHVRRSDWLEAKAAAAAAEEGAHHLGVAAALVTALPVATLYLAAVLCKSAAVPAAVFFPALDAAFFPALWGVQGAGTEEKTQKNVARSESGSSAGGAAAGRRARATWRAACVGYAAVAAVAAVGIAGAAYGNRSHRENVTPVHNGGEGLHPPQRAALAVQQVLEAVGRTLAPDAWSVSAVQTVGSAGHLGTDPSHGEVRGPRRIAMTVRAALALRAKYPLPPVVDPAGLGRAAALLLAAVLAVFACAAAIGRTPLGRPARRHSVCGPVVSRWSLLLGVYLATILPATSLFKHGYDSGGADRYAHLPSLALVLPAYAVLHAALGAIRTGKPSDAAAAAATAAAAAAAIVCACRLTWRHSEAWRDGAAFTRREFAAQALATASCDGLHAAAALNATAVSPVSCADAAYFAAANDYALELHRAEDCEGVLALTSPIAPLAATSARPSHESLLLTHTACAYALRRDLPGALTLLKAAAETYPESAAVALNAGTIAWATCDAAEARRFVDAAVRLAPDWRAAREAAAGKERNEERCAAASVAGKEPGIVRPRGRREAGQHPSQNPFRHPAAAGGEEDGDGPTLPSSSEIDAKIRRAMAALGEMTPPPVVLTWPITALSGWGTAGRALVREMLRGGLATPILIAPLPPRSAPVSSAETNRSADLREEFTADELADLRRSQRVLRRMLELQVARRLVDGDPAVAQDEHRRDAPLEIVAPLPVIHALGNAFVSSAGGGGAWEERGTPPRGAADSSPPPHHA